MGGIGIGMGGIGIGMGGIEIGMGGIGIGMGGIGIGMGLGLGWMGLGWMGLGCLINPYCTKGAPKNVLIPYSNVQKSKESGSGRVGDWNWE